MDPPALCLDWYNSIMAYTLESNFKIWNDDMGTGIEVSDDRDGSGLTSISEISKDENKPELLFDDGMLVLLIKALERKLASHREG